MSNAANYGYSPVYGYSTTSGSTNSYYQQPSRGVVGDMWRQPSVNPNNYYQQPSRGTGGDVSYGYDVYKKYEQTPGRGGYLEVGHKDEFGKLGGEFQTNYNRGLYGRGYEKEYISSGAYEGTSTGYAGTMTGATNDIGTAVNLLMGASSGGSGTRIREVESPVNYYPAMHSTMDASKRYGSFSLAPRRSYAGEPPKYY
ncbi:hypothetical protein MLD38_035898 [Melastoma candidum]|uniref:Uncharacterized protein n=1 Tax=Melastoma candidum TaxID=119954 RepID=A0ACB9LI75_9MYRT|nr:hypothetical protein MLD38_035898 [Melastoma candidum]